MSAPSTSRSAEHFGAAVTTLGDRLHRLTWDELPAPTRDRLELSLVDLVGVSQAGLRTPEVQALAAAAPLAPGDRPWLHAVAAACLELDEGNKYAVGHPAAHVFFAAVAAARGRQVAGRQLLTAVAAGYELAARVGRALRRDARWHTHGHWGVLGAAWAAARVRGLDADACARAVGAAGSLMRVAPWQAVLDGDFTRNLWMADAVTAGVHASDLAAAGLAPPPSNAYAGLSLVGEVDPSLLDADPDRWLCGEGYLKLHSACSYTHPAIDLVLALRDQLPDATAVRVRTGSLSRPLLQRRTDSRLAAMFSLPFAVATAWAHGEVTPAVMDPGSDAFARSAQLLDRVEVEIDEALDGWLPDRRVTEVAVSDGTTTVSLAAPNPIGDAAHFPLTRDDVRAKLTRLLGADAADDVRRTMDALPGSADVDDVLGQLPG